eukprot:765436-Hanusia_phi.AAC.1
MQHAAGSFALQLFVWSYLFIAVFLLMNIFLAILVDAYSSVKQETQEADSLVTELFSVVWHEIRRRLPLGSSFISDEKLRALLLAGDKSLSQHKIRQQVNQVMDSGKVIVLPGYPRMDVQGLQQLLHESMTSSSMTRDDEALYELLERYGCSPEQVQDKRLEDLSQLVSLEHMRRSFGIDTQASNQQELSSVAPDHLSGRKLVTLTVVSASNLPKMDVLRHSDAYCIVYVDGDDQQPIYRTPTIASCMNPEWHSSFEWLVKPNMRRLTISVWDEDNLTADDLIGTAVVDLTDLDVLDEEMALELDNPRLRKRLKKLNTSIRVKVGTRWDARNGDNTGKAATGQKQFYSWNACNAIISM